MTVTTSETALHVQALDAERQRQGRRRAERLLAHVDDASLLLVERHGAHQVWLFGSLAAGEPTIYSDVDLAVEGLSASAYFTALGDLMALFRGPVDLVRLEEASESLRERILSEGRALV